MSNISTRKLYWYEDRNCLDTDFIRLKNLIRFLLHILIDIGALVGIYLMRRVMMSNSAIDKRHEQRIKELDPWQQDIAYRDSLIRTHSLDRLKRLHEDK